MSISKQARAPSSAGEAQSLTFAGKLVDDDLLMRGRRNRHSGREPQTRDSARSLDRPGQGGHDHAAARSEIAAERIPIRGIDARPLLIDTHEPSRRLIRALKRNPPHLLCPSARISAHGEALLGRFSIERLEPELQGEGLENWPVRSMRGVHRAAMASSECSTARSP